MRSVSAEYTAAATASALTYNIPALIVTFLAPTPTLQFATRSNVAICWISQHGINSVTTNRKGWRGGFDSILLCINTSLPLLVKEKHAFNVSLDFSMLYPLVCEILGREKKTPGLFDICEDTERQSSDHQRFSYALLSYIALISICCGPTYQGLGITHRNSSCHVVHFDCMSGHKWQTFKMSKCHYAIVNEHHIVIVVCGLQQEPAGRISGSYS